MSDDSSRVRRDKGTFYGFPSLAAAFDMAVNEYEQERERFIRSELADLGGGADKAVAQIEAAADALIKGAGELVSLDSVPAAREILSRDLRNQQNERLSELISERVSIDLGHEMVSLVNEANLRVWMLVALSQPIKPSARTAEFLKHVSRCYIFGFMSECVILCRSVLDAEFEAEISGDDCIGELGVRKPPYYGLADRIAVAVKRGRISPEAAGYARTVQETGNRAVHRKPDAVPDAIPIIALTLHVIRELSDSA